MHSDSPREPGPPSPEQFRWRGGEITRLEGLSDAVFAFAVTLLIVSLEVPHTFNQLLAAMHGFYAFAICFALLIMIWYQQYIFFRRYGLQDAWTIFLNSALLFVVLFYIYPLKFLFELLVDAWGGGPLMVHDAVGRMVPVIEQRQLPQLMLVYDAGYVAVSLIVVFMFLHAWRLREVLSLSQLEQFDTVASAVQALLGVVVGLVSAIFALVGSSAYVALAGWCYPILLAPLMTAHGIWRGRQRRKLQQAL